MKDDAQRADDEDGLELVVKIPRLVRCNDIEGKNLTVFIFGRRKPTTNPDAKITRVDVYEGDPDLGEATRLERKYS